ncbi:hypothetical protein D9M70_637680 [compost metagenome]
MTVVPVADRLQTLGCKRYSRSLRTAIFGFARIQYIDFPVDSSMGVKRSIERKGALYESLESANSIGL